MKEKMNIALCTNSNYVMPTVVCITSILENNKGPTDFYILYSELTEKEILFLKGIITQYGSDKSFNPIKIDSGKFNNYPTFGRSKEAYFRILIPYVLPNIDKCLYLDGDTLVKGSLGNFYNETFDGKALIVCEDMGEMMFYHKERHSLLGIPKESKYFNSGVLIFNNRYFRERIDLDKIFAYININPDKLKFLDQDVLNALFYDQVKYSLSNLYDYLEILVNPLITNDGVKKAVIIHYIQKPWRFTYNGINQKYWWEYGKKTYRANYYKFLIINTIYRKLLGLILIVISINTLKSVLKRSI